jgi:hypothetical protein
MPAFPEGGHFLKDSPLAPTSPLYQGFSGAMGETAACAGVNIPWAIVGRPNLYEAFGLDLPEPLAESTPRDGLGSAWTLRIVHSNVEPSAGRLKGTRTASTSRGDRHCSNRGVLVACPQLTRVYE